MRRTTRSKVLWAIWMTGGGLVTALVVYRVTGSAGWALLGLVVSGPVLNLLAQIVLQPARAVGTSRSRPKTD